ncbi:MAG: hypothetical protein DHS20C18_10800 [Saprospiraceae bacterium]|nr:MAG: hypothetical protein DHS20C18_10800 [Saprospiraceae bacterium]
MSIDKLKIRSFNPVTKQYEYHINDIAIIDEEVESTIYTYLTIHEENEPTPYRYLLSTNSHQAFKAVEDSSDGTYYWEKQASLQNSNMRFDLNRLQLKKTKLDFNEVLPAELLGLFVIGSDDARLGLVGLTPAMGNGSEIGFKLHETKTGWLTIECYCY